MGGGGGMGGRREVDRVRRDGRGDGMAREG